MLRYPRRAEIQDCQQDILSLSKLLSYTIDHSLWWFSFWHVQFFRNCSSNVHSQILTKVNIPSGVLDITLLCFKFILPERNVFHITNIRMEAQDQYDCLKAILKGLLVVHKSYQTIDFFLWNTLCGYFNNHRNISCPYCDGKCKF